MLQVKNYGLFTILVIVLSLLSVHGQVSNEHFIFDLRFFYLQDTCATRALQSTELEDYAIISQDKFPGIQAMFGKQDGQFQGYNWTPFNVTTSDGWALTLFRFSSRCNYVRGNVLLVHDTFMDTESLLEGYFIGKPMPLQLNDNCYTVWMGDNRGTRTSQKYVDGEPLSNLLPDYWDFTIQDMALKDLRSFIFKIYGMTESYDMKVITYG